MDYMVEHDMILCPHDNWTAAYEQLKSMKKEDVESVVQSLIGAIPDTDMSLEEMQEERRRKYETAD